MFDDGMGLVWFGFLFALAGDGNQWIGLGFLQECSGILKGVTSRGALLMCKFDINHDALFCSTSAH